MNDRKTHKIVLIGLMGSGKSSVGKQLSEMIGLPFIDVDQEIERMAACSIAEIFSRFGEVYFRNGERRIMNRLLLGEPAVLATGGGAYMDEQTRHLISELGTSIWLRADLDVLVHRTTGRSHRPLLNQGNPREILSKLIDLRYPIYAQADIIVDSTEVDTHLTVQNVYHAWLKYCDSLQKNNP
jgi:shikimate kinase